MSSRGLRTLFKSSSCLTLCGRLESLGGKGGWYGSTSFSQKVARSRTGVGGTEGKNTKHMHLRCCSCVGYQDFTQSTSTAGVCVRRLPIYYPLPQGLHGEGGNTDW